MRAALTGRSYESVRTFAAGTVRPRRVSRTPAVLRLAPPQLGPSWPWFTRRYLRADTERDRIIAAADHLVHARALTAGDDLATGLAFLVPA